MSMSHAAASAATTSSSTIPPPMIAIRLPRIEHLTLLRFSFAPHSLGYAAPDPTTRTTVTSNRVLSHQDVCRPAAGSSVGVHVSMAPATSEKSPLSNESHATRGDLPCDF